MLRHDNTRFENAFLQACHDGELALVQDLVERGTNIHVTDNDDFSALHLAVQGGHSEVVLYLLEKGANVWVREPNHGTCYFSLGRLLNAERGMEAIMAVLVATVRQEPPEGWLEPLRHSLGTFLLILNSNYEGKLQDFMQGIDAAYKNLKSDEHAVVMARLEKIKSILTQQPTREIDMSLFARSTAAARTYGGSSSDSDDDVSESAGVAESVACTHDSSGFADVSSPEEDASASEEEGSDSDEEAADSAGSAVVGLFAPGRSATPAIRSSGLLDDLVPSIDSEEDGSHISTDSVISDGEDFEASDDEFTCGR